VCVCGPYTKITNQVVIYCVETLRKQSNEFSDPRKQLGSCVTVSMTETEVQKGLAFASAVTKRRPYSKSKVTHRTQKEKVQALVTSVHQKFPGVAQVVNKHSDVLQHNLDDYTELDEVYIQCLTCPFVKTNAYKGPTFENYTITARPPECTNFTAHYRQRHNKDATQPLAKFFTKCAAAIQYANPVKEKKERERKAKELEEAKTEAAVSSMCDIDGGSDADDDENERSPSLPTSPSSYPEVQPEMTQDAEPRTTAPLPLSYTNAATSADMEIARYKIPFAVPFYTFTSQCPTSQVRQRRQRALWCICFEGRNINELSKC